MAVCLGGGRLAQASISENGTAWGAGGDQTGGETNTSPYYDYPWDCYLRFSGQQTPVAPALLATHVRYGAHVLAGSWQTEVTDVGEGDDGFAGVPFASHDLIYMRVDEGELRYQVHTIEDGWLDWVNQGNPADTVNGCAGGARSAHRRGAALLHDTGRQDPLPGLVPRPDRQQDGVAGHGVRRRHQLRGGGGDDFAGMYGEPIDRLQIAICDQNPYR